MRATKTVAIIVGFLAFVQAAAGQLRIAQWNITNWSSADLAARGAAFQTSFYGVVPSGPLAGQQMSPDVLIVEEIVQGGSGNTSSHQATGQANVDAFRGLLNGACGCSNDWASAPYVANGGDTGAALFYRSSKMTFVSTASLTQNTGSGSTQAPRDTMRWRIRVFGFSGAPAELYLYGSHMKAQGTGSDVRRDPEGLRIRNDTNGLPAAAGGFILGGDFNITDSTDLAYQYLVAYGTGYVAGDVRLVQAGQFFDPISRPGHWNSTCSFRNIHTQEPSSGTTPGSPTTGGMDDRFDQLLISASLRDTHRMSYLPYSPGGNIFAAFVSAAAGCPAVLPASTTTAWYDPNHSYRCWGNDGNHYNDGIVAGSYNTEVGMTIAQALVTTCATNGHLPVYMDLQVPAKLGALSGTIDLGTVVQNTTASYTLQIANVADLARFSKDGTGWGIDALTYSLAISPGAFSLPGGTGPFTRAATNPAQVNSHTVGIDTSATGDKTATLTITSDDPDNPSRVLTLMIHVDPPAPTTGACCISGNCTVTTQAACGGVYQGNGQACTAGLCPEPTGACCAADGGCTVMTQVQCAAGGYRGDDTVCSPNPCPQPGACCTPATGACVLMLQADCQSGTWNGAGACAPNPCPQPPGACCTGVSCTSTTQAGCAGVFQGPGSACGAAGNPTTCCPANFNAVGGVSVQDIFDFLAAWFGNDPRADFNGSGAVSVQDIFDFLAAWFTGC